MAKAKKEEVKTSKGLKDRMESFFFEMTSPDGKVTKIGQTKDQ